MRLGRYVLVQPIGAGGMAEVWEALDEVIKRTVALKLVLPTFTAEKEFAARFLREARLAAVLDHPNILQVWDVGTFEDRPFIVTALLAGGRLADRMSELVPDERALKWLEALASALDHAHARQVVHRDVKPANVLFDRKGKLYLSDFGIAKSLEESTILTQDGAVVGTPAYMSPEQAMGIEVGPGADQYSLGILAYRLVSGQLPYDRKTPTPVLLHKAIYEDPPPPSKFRTQLGPRVDAVFERALAKKPERRFRSCQDFVGSLSIAMSGSSLVDGPAAVRLQNLTQTVDSDAITAPNVPADLRSGMGPSTGFTTQPLAVADANAMAATVAEQTPQSQAPDTPPPRKPSATFPATGSENPHRGRTAFLAGIAITATLVIAGVFALKALKQGGGPEGSTPPTRESSAGANPARSATPVLSPTSAPPETTQAPPSGESLPENLIAALSSPSPPIPRPTATAKSRTPTATRPVAAPPTATVAVVAPAIPPTPSAATPVVPTPVRPTPAPPATIASTPRVPAPASGPVRLEEARLLSVSARLKDPSLLLVFKFDRPVTPPGPGSLRVESIISGASGSFLLRTATKDLNCLSTGADSISCPLPLRLFDEDKRRQLKPESELEITVSTGSKRILKAVRFLESD